MSPRRGWQTILLTLVLSTIPLLSGSMIASAPEVPDHVVISEVYVNAVDEHNSEWVELYNPTNEDVDIGGWVIDTATYPSDATIPVDEKILAHGFYLIGDGGWTPDNSGWPDPGHEEEITLKNSDGYVRLRDSDGNVIDIASWGSDAADYEGAPYPDNPAEGHSIERKALFAGYAPCQDTDNNVADFTEQETPTPMDSSSILDPAPVYGVELTVAQAEKTTEPGVTARYTLTVKNTGNTTDSFTLSIENVNGAEVAELSKDIVTLEPVAAEEVTLGVTDSDVGEYLIKVTVISQGDPSKSATAETKMTVIIKVKEGDIDDNGEINTIDARIAWQYELGLIKLTDKQKRAGDVNSDGAVNKDDAILIAKYAIGLIRKFEIGTNEKAVTLRAIFPWLLLGLVPVLIRRRVRRNTC